MTKKKKIPDNGCWEDFIGPLWSVEEFKEYSSEKDIPIYHLIRRIVESTMAGESYWWDEDDTYHLKEIPKVYNDELNMSTTEIIDCIMKCVKNKKGKLIGPEDCEEQFLMCKKCGYKQRDITTVLMYKVKYPGVPAYDIPYKCGACMDNEEEEE